MWRCCSVNGSSFDGRAEAVVVRGCGQAEVRALLTVLQVTPYMHCNARFDMPSRESRRSVAYNSDFDWPGGPDGDVRIREHLSGPSPGAVSFHEQLTSPTTDRTTRVSRWSRRSGTTRSASSPAGGCNWRCATASWGRSRTRRRVLAPRDRRPRPAKPRPSHGEGARRHPQGQDCHMPVNPRMPVAEWGRNDASGMMTPGSSRAGIRPEQPHSPTPRARRHRLHRHARGGGGHHLHSGACPGRWRVGFEAPDGGERSRCPGSPW